MEKIKTSILIDRNVWERFKKEITKRFKGRRSNIPAVSDVIEDLIRNWIYGLHRSKIPIYEVAYLASLEPEILLKYARINPQLAFKLFQSKPEAFMQAITLEPEPKQPIKTKSGLYENYYRIEESRIVMLEEVGPDEWDVVEIWHIVDIDLGEPYFNGFKLDKLLGEGYSAVIPMYLQKKSQLCIAETITFSLKNKSAWKTITKILKDLTSQQITVTSTYIKEKECDGFKLERETIRNWDEIINGIQFLELLGEWLPENTPI